MYESMSMSMKHQPNELMKYLWTMEVQEERPQATAAPNQHRHTKSTNIQLHRCRCRCCRHCANWRGHQWKLVVGRTVVVTTPEAGLTIPAGLKKLTTATAFKVGKLILYCTRETASMRWKSKTDIQECPFCLYPILSYLGFFLAPFRWVQFWCPSSSSIAWYWFDSMSPAELQNNFAFQP